MPCERQPWSRREISCEISLSVRKEAKGNSPRGAGKLNKKDVDRAKLHAGVVPARFPTGTWFLTERSSSATIFTVFFPSMLRWYAWNWNFKKARILNCTYLFCILTLHIYFSFRKVDLNTRKIVTDVKSCAQNLFIGIHLGVLITRESTYTELDFFRHVWRRACIGRSNLTCFSPLVFNLVKTLP